MKKIFITFAILITSLCVTAQIAYDHFQIQVDGLGCPFCAYGLEKKFKEFKGLKKVTINIQTGNFEFDYPTEKGLSMESVIEQVNKAGYTPKIAKISRQDGTIESRSLATNSDVSKNNAREKLSLRVNGNCEMCKARIEATALAIEGVESAIWNINSKTLEFKTSTSKKMIATKIAEAGHDNELKKANPEVYNSLPPCCSYRK